MATAEDTSRPSAADDGGFTLAEVVWALFLLSLVAMAALGLFLSGMSSVADMQRQQVAASLASTALDKARSVTSGAVNTAGTSGLIKGRSQDAVMAVWNDASAADTADMKPAYDTGSYTTQQQWVPVRATETVGNQEYTVDILVGECIRPEEASTAAQPCATFGDNVPAGYSKIYRVRAIVRWDEGDGVEQTYSATTLVDPSPDVTWNTALLPYAYDDEFTVIAGDPATFHTITANDTVEMGSGNPVVMVTNPAHGTVTLGSGTGNTGIYFTPPSDSSGTVTFTYRVRDAAGQISLDVATVTVHILPRPINDPDLAVDPDSNQIIDDLLLANDRGVSNVAAPGRVTTIVPVVDTSIDMFGTDEVTPAMLAAREADRAALADRGVTVDPDGKVRFQASSTVGDTVTFSYYLVDDGTGSDVARYPNVDSPATVTITVDNPLLVADESVVLDATSSTTWNEIDWLDLTGNSEGVEIRVDSVTGVTNAASNVRVDGTTGVGQGSTLEFRTTSSNVAIYEVTYYTISESGRESPEAGTLTITVAPVPQAGSVTLDDDNYGDAAYCTGRGRDRVCYDAQPTYADIDLRASVLGTASSNVRITSLVRTGAGSSNYCGTWERRDTGLRITPVELGSGSARTCTFEYTATSINPAVPSQSSGTLTVRVNP